jgi:hypothetical protein
VPGEGTLAALLGLAAQAVGLALGLEPLIAGQHADLLFD